MIQIAPRAKLLHQSVRGVHVRDAVTAMAHIAGLDNRGVLSLREIDGTRIGNAENRTVLPHVGHRQRIVVAVVARRRRR